MPSDDLKPVEQALVDLAELCEDMHGHVEGQNDQMSELIAMAQEQNRRLDARLAGAASASTSAQVAAEEGDRLERAENGKEKEQLTENDSPEAVISSASPLNSSIDGLDTRPRSPNGATFNTEQDAHASENQSMHDAKQSAPSQRPPEKFNEEAVAKEMHALIRQLQNISPPAPQHHSPATVLSSIETHSPLTPNLTDPNPAQQAVTLFADLTDKYLQRPAQIGMREILQRGEVLWDLSGREKILLGTLAVVTKALAIVSGLEVGRGYEEVHAEVLEAAGVVQRRLEKGGGRGG